jgi:D-aminopeptidase
LASASLATRLDRVIGALPDTYPGPGGAIAVLKDGEPLARHAWGWANAERRIPFTARSLFRICSITKQFTCALLLDAFPDPTRLDDDIRARLPLLRSPAPGALDLCHNQSGLRDYWAVAMLLGSPAEAPFGESEAKALVGQTRSLQFAPGARYSYCNQNFRLLSEILEARTGRRFAELLRTRIFDPAGMESALLAADTRAMPDGTEGYEGAPEIGFRAAENRILWTGDAGIGASLDDMIAWERFIDATRDDPDGLYRRLSAPVTFADGGAAAYGFGLARSRAFGRPLTGHAGGLRGWRSERLYMPGERVSVVALLNHLSDAHGVVTELLGAVLDEAPPPPPARSPATPSWFGAYLEPETGLSARIEPASAGRARLRFTYPGELLDLQADGASAPEGPRLRRGEDGLWMERPRENMISRLVPLAGEARPDIAGRYACAELNSELTIADAGGALHGAFSGVLGQGRMEQLRAVGPDVWNLPCPRALDFTPPGDWTLAFTRDGDRVDGVKVGCWLARGLDYRRL